MPHNTSSDSPEGCASCSAVGVTLLACDDPDYQGPSEKPRYCSDCMVGKKVKVFWPVDGSWYTGVVQEYDSSSGEHLLRYPDGDSEWVRIGEANTSQIGDIGSGPMSPVTGIDHAVAAMSPNKWHDPLRGGANFPPPNLQGYGSPYLPPNMYGMVFSPGPDAPPPQPMTHSAVRNQASIKIKTSKSDDEDKYKRDDRKKTGPRSWTKEEDAVLLNVVQTMNHPIKWSTVSSSLEGRTGKQCRERYVNHLNPRLKVTDWNLVEDYTIFFLYDSIGSHWAKLTKAIPGRTDNGIKNRFHNVRRQAEREDDSRAKIHSVKEYVDRIRMDRIRKIPEKLQTKTSILWDQEVTLPMVAGGIQAPDVGKEIAIKSNVDIFGPYRAPRDGEMCVRCGMLIPSLETGYEVCSRTGWCVSCTKTPAHLTDNMLRHCHLLFRESDSRKRAIIESWADPLKEKRPKKR